MKSLDDLQNFARAIHSDYLRRQSERKEQELSEALFSRIKNALDEVDYQSLLELMADMKEAALRQVSDQELLERSTELEKEVDRLKRENHELSEKLMAR